MAYEQHADGTLTPLPKQNIDTGLGLERGAAILQDVRSVYETDGYRQIMDWIAAESGVAYGDSPAATKAHRILADHGRGMTFLVGDGVTPSNEGRGYVLRRIIRRAVQQAQRIGLSDVHRLSAVVVEQMGEAYPDLPPQGDEIARVVRLEEERFGETLERGLKLFEELGADEAISGEQAFTLAATYGFPRRADGRARRRSAARRSTSTAIASRWSATARSRAPAAPASRSGRRDFARSADFTTEFVGYAKTDVLTQIGAYEALEDDLFLAKLRESPFYPAGGGQVTDAGTIELDDDSGTTAELVEAYRLENDQALLFRGSGFAAGDRVRARVPWSVRFPTMANHTGTHLLHQALRDVLGEHVHQAGSAVRPDKLRFDFTHDQRAERRGARRRRAARERARLREPARARLRDADRRGAKARRDDALRREVRRHRPRRRSARLLRRAVWRHARRLERRDRPVRRSSPRARSAPECGAWKLSPRARRGRCSTSARGSSSLFGRRSGRSARPRKPRRSAARADVPEPEVRAEGGVNVIVQPVDGLDADELLDLSDRYKQRHAPAAIVLGSNEDGKVHLVASFDASVAEKVSAADVLREAAAIVGGGGGGRPTMARAGGKDPEKLPDALAEAERLIVAAL